MIIDASELYDQFEQGFEQYGSTYSPDFHGMSDLSQAKARQINGWAKLPSVKWVPAVAAVNTGMSPYVVGDLLKRYDVKPEEFTQLGHDLKWAMYSECTESYTIAKGILEGFEANDLFRHSLGTDTNPILEMTLAHSRLRENWPLGRIESLAAKFTVGAAEPEDFLNLEPSMLFKQARETPPFPNDSMFDFISRMGLLHPEVAKKRFHPHAAWEAMFIDMYTQGTVWRPTFMKCMATLVGEPRTRMIKAISTMVPDASDIFYPGTSGFAYEALMQELGKLGVDDVGDSTVMQLNFLPLGPLADRKKVTALDYFDDLLDNPTSILGKLALELDGLASDDFALAHFTALHRLSQLGYREQDPSSFDPNAFALKVLHGYEAFSTPDEVYASDEKLKIDEMARQGVHTLISTLVRVHDFDHSLFRNLQSRSIAILAGAGLDKSQLPKMTTRDLGRVFGEELGL